MESIYTELALYGSKNECARTDTIFLLISEVCNGKVSLAVSSVCIVTIRLKYGFSLHTVNCAL